MDQKAILTRAESTENLKSMIGSYEIEQKAGWRTDSSSKFEGTVLLDGEELSILRK